MKSQSVSFVPATEVFKDLPLAWWLFTESEPNMTWGDEDVTHTLVTVQAISYHMGKAVANMKGERQCEDQVQEVIRRLVPLASQGTFVDLET